jgi:hypothetical protein
MQARTCRRGRRQRAQEGGRTRLLRTLTPFRGSEHETPRGQRPGATALAVCRVAAHYLPSGLSPSVLEFHQVNQLLEAAGSRTITAGSELHRPRSARTLRSHHAIAPTGLSASGSCPARADSGSARLQVKITAAKGGHTAPAQAGEGRQRYQRPVSPVVVAVHPAVSGHRPPAPIPSWFTRARPAAGPRRRSSSIA